MVQQLHVIVHVVPPDMLQELHGQGRIEGPVRPPRSPAEVVVHNVRAREEALRNGDNNNNNKKNGLWILFPSQSARCLLGTSVPISRCNATTPKSCSWLSQRCQGQRKLRRQDRLLPCQRDCNRKTEYVHASTTRREANTRRMLQWTP
jgi:hypothetical protein